MLLFFIFIRFVLGLLHHRMSLCGALIYVFSFYGTMPNPIKSGQSYYKNQPGRIEDYITGHSSVSEKEKKEVRQHFLTYMH